jgi:hypothetical protein
MKKLTILFMVMLLASSCTCLLSQIPPQMIYAGEGCTAALPDYIPLVAVSDNCSIAAVTQTPSAGFILDAVTMSVTVKIRATDKSGNYSEVSFPVSIVDTIKPVITWDGEVIAAANWDVINSIYDQADRLLAQQEDYFDMTFDWSGIPEDLRPIDQYNKKILLTWTSPGHATKGYGSRAFTFVSQNDTFTIK